MTQSATLDVAIYVAAHLLVVLLPWIVLHVVYIGHVNPYLYSEQTGTFLRARVFLAYPAVVALCWYATRWFDTGHDVLIALYTVVIVRLLDLVARMRREQRPVLNLIFRLVIAPVVGFLAVLWVFHALSEGGLNFFDWVLGGLLSILVPPLFVVGSLRALDAGIGAVSS